jgi:hypothetical protein
VLEIIKSKAEHWKIQFNYVKKGRETEAAGGADALAEGHRLVPQNLTHLSEQDTQRVNLRARISPHPTFLAQKTSN